MAFYVRNPATDQAIRRLAKLEGKTLTDTIREAVVNETGRERARFPLRDRIAAIQDDVAALARPGGKPADKAFFDDLSGDP
jgi:antitoxin VapB